MSRKRERHDEDRRSHPYDVPAEEFIAVPIAGEFPEWLPGMHETPAGENTEDELRWPHLQIR